MARAVSEVRTMGTNGATLAFFPFVVSVGLLDRLAAPPTGVLGTALAGGAPWFVYVARRDIGLVAERLAGS